MFKRKVYIEKISKELDNKNDILVLVWARQVWKTTILKSLIDFSYIKEDETLFLYWDELFEMWIEKSSDLKNIIFEKININKIKFLIIDEAQYIKNIGIILKILIDQVRKWDFNFKIIVTWSWSIEIFRWITDSLIWRKKIINIYSFSFLEFLEYKGFDVEKIINNDFLSIESINKLNFYFDEFISYWSYPRVIIEKNSESKLEILNNLYKDYIYKDIWFYLKEDEIVYFDKFLKYISWWVCSTLNINEIIGNIWIPKRMLERFIFLVENTFVVNFLPSFYKNKQKEISKSKKIYFSDLGFLRKILWISFINQDNRWKFIDNFVFLELLKYKTNLEEIFYYSKKSQSQIDFILQDWFTWNIKPIEVKSWSKDNIPIIFKSFLSDYREIIDNFYVVNNGIIKTRQLEEKDVLIISYLCLFKWFLRK